MQNKDKNGFKTWYAISFAFQLGFLIVVPIGGFMLLGLWGDKSFHTTPFLFIAGLVIGILITAYEVYHLLIPLINPVRNSEGSSRYSQRRAASPRGEYRDSQRKISNGVKEK